MVSKKEEKGVKHEEKVEKVEAPPAPPVPDPSPDPSPSQVSNDQLIRDTVEANNRRAAEEVKKEKK